MRINDYRVEIAAYLFKSAIAVRKLEVANQEKIDDARKQLDADVTRAFDLLHSRGLLTDEEAAEWEQQKGRGAIEAIPTIEAPPEDLVKKYEQQGFAPDDARREAAIEVQIGRAHV